MDRYHSRFPAIYAPNFVKTNTVNYAEKGNEIF